MNALRPLACLLPEGTANALIILNRPLDVPLMTHLWKSSVFVAVTDGAINRLDKHFGSQKENFLPNVITGDFDSANPDTLDYYKNRNVDIVRTPDQDETDFTKCMRIVCERINQKEARQIVVIGAFGGRLDHSLANMNTLYTSLKISKVPVFLFHENSMACLLAKGQHKLECNTGLEGDWCGLVPLGQPAKHVTTTGLKYNLNDDGMAFGELISTSNSLAASEVTITTDQPLLWMMGYKNE